MKTLQIGKPNLIVGFGANHRCMTSRARTPILFSKSNNCVIGDGQSIEVPFDTKMVWAEAELAVVIGRRTKNVTYADAKSHIKGYTIANDVNRLNIYGRSEDLAFGKCCDTFLPLLHEAHVVNPLNLAVKSYINGNLVQDCSTSDLIFDVYEAVSYASRYFTFDDGDIIITGTDCRGKSIPLADGDDVVIEIENIGRLKNHVVWQKSDWIYSVKEHQPALQK